MLQKYLQKIIVTTFLWVNLYQSLLGWGYTYPSEKKHMFFSWDDEVPFICLEKKTTCSSHHQPDIIVQPPLNHHFPMVFLIGSMNFQPPTRYLAAPVKPSLSSSLLRGAASSSPVNPAGATTQRRRRGMRKRKI